MEAFYQNRNLRLKRVFFKKREIELIKIGLDHLVNDNKIKIPAKDKLTLSALIRDFKGSM